MATQLPSKYQNSDDEQNTSAVHPSSAHHPQTPDDATVSHSESETTAHSAIERSTPPAEESDFAVYLSQSVLVDEETQPRHVQSSLRTRQDTQSPDNATPEEEHSPLPSENPPDDEHPPTGPHNHAYQPPTSVDRDGHASGETLHSREESASDDVLNQHPNGLIGNRKEPEWIPYTLRWQSLALLVISTVILLSLVVTLWWQSVVDNGLGPDDGSSTLLFGWRFTPPLLAVLYVQMTSMLLDDVKRTECFARMAQPGGSTAASSILRAPGAWWNALADGLSKHGGRRSWLLFSTACLNIIGFLSISPLSSSFLDLAEVMVTDEVDFTRVTTQQRISLVSSRETNLRIIGHILQNISTSAWMSDNYTVLPFWPSTLANPALGPELPGPFQTWQANTWVLNTELECNKTSVFNFDSNNEGDILWWRISASDKCQYKINKSNVFNRTIWYNAFSYDDDVQQSEDCEETDLILVIPGDGEGQICGQACFAKYYMAEMTVTAHVSTTDSIVVFDEEQYLQKRRPMSSSFLKVEEVQNISLAGGWDKYLPLGKDIDTYQGPDTCKGLSALLLATYNFDFAAMADDDNIIPRAIKVKQEVFAERLQYSLQTQGAPTDSVAGKATKIESQVIVNAGVAIALASLLGISLLLLLVIWPLSRIRIRPLNLKQDPAAVTGIATLISPGSHTHENLRRLKNYSQTLVQSTLGEKQYYMNYSTIHELDPTAEIPEVEEDSSSISSDWRPLVLRLRTLTAFVLYLVTLLTAVLVLYSFAQRSSLYETAFVYQTKIPVFGGHTLTPFSLVPTLLAVVVGLWWGSVDATFRRLQPYLSMAEAPQHLAYGATLSYQSSYWVWAAFKAASRKHWFLLLVTAGTSLSPVLTIAMSALLIRTQINTSTLHQVSRGLELRQIPYLSEYQTWSPRDGYKNIEIIYDLYRNLSTNWLYSATLQLTMGGSQPPWSHDGWSFIPIDVAQFSNSSQNMDPSSGDWATNISITTPAIRGRLDCSPYESLDNVSAWLTLQDLYNGSDWDGDTIPHETRRAYQPGSLKDGEVWPYFFNTSYLSNGGIPACCMNGSSWPPSASALGRWSVSDNPYAHLHPPFNLTTKWMYGRVATGLKHIRPILTEDPEDIEYMVFLAMPSAQALDCTPIIETSSAWVTVDQRSGSVKDFRILEEPKEASEAWTHNFIAHNNNESMDPHKVYRYNITVSYGILFLTSLLHASSLNDLDVLEDEYPWQEDLSDNVFTFRDPDNGLNLDAMSYAMYALAGKDPEALLDADTLEATAQKAFSTFFQHFISSGISNNLSLSTGRTWAYQPINATLPPCLMWDDSGPVCSKPSVWPVSHNDRTADAQTWRRVSVLRMNAVAVWLSVGILAWLIVTVVVVAAALRWHLRGLKGDVERVVDVLLMVARSDRLLRLVNEGGERAAAKQGVMTRLGWFEDRDRPMRWGIEVVEDEGESRDN